MSHQLREILDTITPTLEHAIQQDPEGYYTLVDTDLQLRVGGHCGIASKSTQLYLQEAHGIPTNIVTNEKVPPSLEHTVLLADNMVIDATYGQFMETMGLSHAVAAKRDVKHLYPKPTIALFPAGASDTFADDFANHLLAAKQHIPPSERNYPHRHFPPEQIRGLFRALWNVENYVPHTFSGDYFQRITGRVAERLITVHS